MNQTRRKLLNAILFFAKNTRNLNTTKLSKLLFFLDFTHFKDTGYPSIGLQYHAFDCGPVPKSFWLEVKDGQAPDDFRYAISIQANNGPEQEYRELRFGAKVEPDLKVFTPREKKILSRLVEFYKHSTAAQLSEISHLKNSPWDKTYHGLGRNAPIEYQLALDKDAACDPAVAEEQLREFLAVSKNFSISPTR